MDNTDGEKKNGSQDIGCFNRSSLDLSHFTSGYDPSTHLYTNKN